MLYTLKNEMGWIDKLFSNQHDMVYFLTFQNATISNRNKSGVDGSMSLTIMWGLSETRRRYNKNSIHCYFNSRECDFSFSRQLTNRSLFLIKSKRSFVRWSSHIIQGRLRGVDHAI